MGQLTAINMFVLHAFKHGNEDDKRFARYILKNELKGVMIANFFVIMLAATRFKNYRNSSLFKCKTILISK